MIYYIAYFGAKFLSFLFFPRTIYGLDDVPSQGAFILASNHISNLDPAILGISSRRRLNYLAKDSLFKNKFLGFCLYRLRAFPVKRETPDPGALRQALLRLKKGQPLILFPEGTRKVEDQKTQAGVGFLALKSGVPIVPVFICGSDRSLPPGAKFFKRAPVQIYYGKPFVVDGNQTYQDAAGQIMNRIRSLNPAPAKL